MERKLVLQGKQTLTVAIPIEWARKNNLDNKSSVQIKEEINKLIISTEKRTPHQSTELNITNNTRLEAMLQIESKYYQGYDEIKIKHNNLQLVREISQSLLGMIIEEYKDNYCVLKSIVETSHDDIKKIIRKTIFILEQQSKGLVKLAKKEINFSTLLTEEDLMDFNNMYAIRYLNKYEQNKEAHAFAIMASTFDMVSDLMGEIAKNIKKDVTRAEQINKIIRTYSKLLQKNKFKELNKFLLKEQRTIKKKTFLDGMIYSLIENLYNYLAYIVEIFNRK